MTDTSKKEIDEKLITRTLAGDESAYAELMDRYRGQLFHLLYKMVYSRIEAEDLVQEAFIKAYKGLESFNREYAFSTWLYKIAVNNCIDYLRKKRLQTYSYDKPMAGKDGEMRREYPDRDAGTDKPMLEKEKSTIINQAIDSLPEKYRTVIHLRHREEMAYEEIAELLDIPIGTVKARIFRAREQLKHLLKGKILP